MSATEQAKGFLDTVPVSGGEYQARHIIRNLIAEREATCTWTDDPEGYWHTDCGEAFEIHAGSPSENGLRFCSFCGRRLVEAK